RWRCGAKVASPPKRWPGPEVAGAELTAASRCSATADRCYFTAHHEPLELRDPLRTRPEADARRRQLAGESVSRGGRRPGLLQVGPGRVADRRRRQQVRGLRRLVGAVDSRPRPPGG